MPRDPEKRRAYKRKWNAENKEKVAEGCRKYYAKHKESIKAKSREYNRKLYAKRREWFQKLLSKPCEHCRTTDKKKLFHHIDPATKNFTIGENITKSMSDILAELDLCVLLCPLCHCKDHKRLKSK